MSGSWSGGGWVCSLMRVNCTVLLRLSAVAGPTGRLRDSARAHGHGPPISRTGDARGSPSHKETGVKRVTRRRLSRIGLAVTLLCLAAGLFSIPCYARLSVGSLTFTLGGASIKCHARSPQEPTFRFYYFGWATGFEFFSMMPRLRDPYSGWVGVAPPFYWSTALAALLTWYLCFTSLRFPKGHCQECGYDLTGNVSGVCPECGEPTAGRCRAPGPAGRRC